MEQTKPIYAEVSTNYLCTDFTPDDGDIKAFVAIDGAVTPDAEESTVIAQVILSKRGDILVAWHDNGARMQNNVLAAIAEAKRKLQELRDSTWDGTTD